MIWVNGAFVTAVLLLGLAPQYALAQECSAVLNLGVFDENRQVVSTLYLSRVQAAVCDHSVGTIQQAKENATRAGVGVDVFSASFATTSAEKNFVSWKNAICAANASELISSGEFQNWSKTASDKIVRATRS